jgi:hypothetical protein
MMSFEAGPRVKLQALMTARLPPFTLSVIA